MQSMKTHPRTNGSDSFALQSLITTSSQVCEMSHWEVVVHRQASHVGHGSEIVLKHWPSNVTGTLWKLENMLTLVLNNKNILTFWFCPQENLMINLNFNCMYVKGCRGTQVWVPAEATVLDSQRAGVTSGLSHLDTGAENRASSGSLHERCILLTSEPSLLSLPPQQTFLLSW